MSSSCITLFEHQFLTYAEIGLADRNSSLRERVLGEIERINQANGLEILSLEHKGLRARSFVGILRAGPYTFEILPKLDAPDAGIRSLTRNLLEMLSYAFDLKLYEFEANGVSSIAPGNWFELLTRFFALGLSQQVISGIPHQYVEKTEALPVLRGRWDIQRQILLHPEDRRVFEVRYEQLSPDTTLNQIFRFVIEQLLQISDDGENRALLRTLAEWFQPVTLLPQVTPELVETFQFTRLDDRYQSVFNLARLFLAGNMLQLSSGSLPVYAFVLDMNVLYEQFVSAFLTRHRRQILPEEWQNLQIRLQGEHISLYLGEHEGQKAFRLKPDVLLLQAGKTIPRLVLDLKYKQLDPSSARPGIEPTDVYQMLAYAVRLKCPLGLLLYPQPAQQAPIRNWYKIDSAQFCLFQATINLHTPLHNPQPLIQELQEILNWVKS